MVFFIIGKLVSLFWLMVLTKVKVKYLMNKSELAQRVAVKTGTSQHAAGEFIDAFVDVIVHCVYQGESVTITGFGVFEQQHRSARTARNIHSGESLRIDATTIPVFRPGSKFKSIINGSLVMDGSVLSVKRKLSYSGRRTIGVGDNTSVIRNHPADDSQIDDFQKGAKKISKVTTKKKSKSSKNEKSKKRKHK